MPLITNQGGTRWPPVNTAPGCRSLIDEIFDSLRRLPEEKRAGLQVQPRARGQGAASTWSYSIDLPQADFPCADGSAAARTVEALCGVVGEVLATATGTNAESAFSELAGAIAAGQGEGTSFMSEETFAPLEVGRGLYVAVELGKLLELAATTMSPEAQFFMPRVDGLDGRLVYGFSLAPGGLSVDVALPLAFFAEMTSRMPEPEKE